MLPTKTRKICRIAQDFDSGSMYTTSESILVNSPYLTLNSCFSRSFSLCLRCLISVLNPSTSRFRLRSRSWYLWFISPRRLDIFSDLSCNQIPPFAIQNSSFSSKITRSVKESKPDGNYLEQLLAHFTLFSNCGQLLFKLNHLLSVHICQLVSLLHLVLETLQPKEEITIQFNSMSFNSLSQKHFVTSFTSNG